MQVDVLLCMIQFSPLIMTSKIIKKLTYKIQSLNAPPSPTKGKTMKTCTISAHHFASPNLRDLAFLKNEGFLLLILEPGSKLMLNKYKWKTCSTK